MNSFVKHIGTKLLAPGLLLLVALATGCTMQVYDDLTDCPQGVRMHFREVVPDEIKYPEAIREIKVFAFDESDVLLEVYPIAVVDSLQGLTFETPLYRPGKTTKLVAWAGSDLATYDFGTPTIGSTTLREMMVRMRNQSADRKADCQPLFVGTPHEGDLKQEERTGTIYDEVTFDLRQISNHVKITLEGLATDRKYDLVFMADNGVYDLLGTMQQDIDFRYLADVGTKPGKRGNAISADFNILKLQEGRDYRVALVDREHGNRIAYSFDLLRDFILYNGPFATTKPSYTLEKNHDFNVWILLDEYKGVPGEEDYMAVMFRVLDWNVVFRTEEAGAL